MKVFGHRTETSVFRRKCFLRVVKGAFQVSIATFWEKDDKVKFTVCGLFRTVCVFFWSERKISQGFQSHKLGVQMKKLGWIFLTHLLSENIFSFWAEKLGVLMKCYRHGCQNCNLRTFGKFWGKTFFFEIDVQTSSDFEVKKIGLLVKKLSSGLLQQEFALPENCFDEKRFLFRKNFYFSVIFFGVWAISLSFVRNSLVRCVKPTINVWREINGKINLEKLFFLNIFGLWAETTGTFSKTVRLDSQNRSLHVQMNIFKRFCGSEKNCLKISGHRTETPDFWWKCFLGVVEGDFKCPVQHFDKKLIRVNFYIFWLV